MQKQLLSDSKSRRTGYRDGLDLQPRALNLVHLISYSSTRGANYPLLWLLIPCNVLLPQHVYVLFVGGELGTIPILTSTTFFPPLLLVVWVI